ncbi:MAG: hypothetical protein JSR33_07885 [Proteobacteria bacterium]|nr:hypothetical protein [Pseudomonadota bacterium]
MRKLGQYLLANPVHAMAAAMLCSVLPLLALPGGFLAGILVGFTTLCRGYKEGLLVLVGVAIPAVMVTFWKHSFLIDLVLLRCLVVWILASVLRATTSWRFVIEIITVIGVIAVIGFYLAIPDVSAWWKALFSHYQGMFNTLVSGQISEDKVSQMINDMAPVATGIFIGLIILLSAFCQSLIARWWQAALYRPGGLGKEFVEIRSGSVLATLMTIVVIAALFHVAIAVDLLPIVIMPLAIAGLCLAHKWVRQNKKIIYLLVAIYIALIFLPVVVISILALAGYVDSWYDIRKHYIVKNLPKKGV